MIPLPRLVTIPNGVPLKAYFHLHPSFFGGGGGQNGARLDLARADVINNLDGIPPRDGPVVIGRRLEC